jgi:hypothetical protein
VSGWTWQDLTIALQFACLGMFLLLAWLDRRKAR